MGHWVQHAHPQEHTVYDSTDKDPPPKRSTCVDTEGKLGVGRGWEVGLGSDCESFWGPMKRFQIGCNNGSGSGTL